MGLSLKNLLIKTPGLFSTRENTTMPEGFEEITEAMAERLADRVPKLLKGLDALQKKTGVSQHHTIELQKWVDKENEELLNLKKTVSERKHSYLKTLSEDARTGLIMRHPIWISNFDVYLDQIQDLFAIHKNESTIVQCAMEGNVFNSLKIFYYASRGNVLCINSNKDLKFVSDETLLKGETDAEQANGEDHPSDEYIFRPVPGGQAQWIFTGNRWGIENHILWLDFGKSEGDYLP
jgi:hypothetical protein